MIETKLKWLNKVNGADIICAKYHQKVLDQFENPTAVIMGSAYGGELEYLGTLWKNCGKVYGYDVFDDLHPKHLAEDVTSFEAECMDYWYGLDEYGTEKMKLEYQQNILNELGLDNVTLIKGEVQPDSCKDISEIHYAFLDMDIHKSMENGYRAVKDKIVSGGYLLLHDIQNILNDWYQEIVVKDKSFKEIEVHNGQLLTILQKV